MHNGTLHRAQYLPIQGRQKWERQNPQLDDGVPVTDLLLPGLVHQLLCLNASQLSHHLQVHSE